MLDQNSDLADHAAHAVARCPRVVFTSYDYEAAAKTIREVYAEQMAELERMREERHRRRLWKMAWERNGRTGSESDGEC